MGEVIRPKNPLAVQRHVDGVLHNDPDFEKTEIVNEVVRVKIHSGMVATAVRMKQLLSDRGVECSVEFINAQGKLIVLPIQSEPERPVLRRGSDGEMDITTMLGDLQDVEAEPDSAEGSADVEGPTSILSGE